MNKPFEPLQPEAPPAFATTATPDWPQLNQRWLTARFAALAARLAGDEGAIVPAELPAGFESAHERLLRIFGLTPFEGEWLLLAAGIECDAPLRAALAALEGGVEQPGIGFDLVATRLPGAHWSAIAPLAPLRHWQLLRLQSDTAPGRARWRIDERVLHHLTGLDAIDTRLQGVAQRLPPADLPEGDEAGGALAEVLSQPAVALLREPPAAGAAGRAASRRFALAGLQRLPLPALWVDADALPADAAARVDCARLLDREAALSGAAIVLAAAPQEGSDLPPALLRFIDSLQSPLVLVGPWPADELAGLQRPVQPVGLPPLPRAARRHALDALARRIESRTQLADLVLPAAALATLREITQALAQCDTVHRAWGFEQAGSRGLGLATLFAGDSGTGKTCAAEAIANALQLDLYRVDLALTVSKYIGETEKNLRRLFDAAEDSGAVLLFDEADALFGKRSEVKDSHDRYANIEVAYLLQRMESYRGLAILTTNLKTALDRAFLRRLRFVVHFPFPDEAARLALWQRQFPPQAPRDADIDWPALARLHLTGGHIRSVVLNAACHAAGEGAAIGQRHLLLAARSEYAKLERSFAGSTIAAGRP